MSGLPRGYTAPPLYGVAVGIVTANELAGGKVLVEFHSQSGDVAHECLVLQSYAGNGFGTFLIPEVGTEVLVACTHGDLREPVVLGCLWYGGDKPPAERKDRKDPKLLMKTKGGHQILLDDSDDAQKIEIVDSGGKNRIVIDTAGDSITIETGGTLRFRAGKIEMEARGTLNLKGQTINLN